MYKYANNAVGNLQDPITNLSTQLSLTGTQYLLFPTLTGGDTFFITLTDAATESIVEICQVTATSGNNFTILRAQDGTTARPWAANDIVSMRAISLQYTDYLSKTFGGTINGIVNINNNLNVTGGVVASGYNVSSDHRNKYNVVPLVNAINNLKKINPVKYNFMREKHKRSGFIAHELQKHFPEMVSGTYNDQEVFQTVDYIQLIPWLVSAICELEEKFSKMKVYKTMERAESGRSRERDNYGRFHAAKIGKSQKTISRNIKKEINSGKPKKQAVAIALSKSRQKNKAK